jgi:L-Ala-D/L-Glu epimerase / N-acetyl-D-glutamate racemase
VAVINGLFAPAVKGISLLAREQVRQKLSRKAAIDMAIWDAWDRTIGRSVHELLGGYTDSLRITPTSTSDSPISPCSLVIGGFAEESDVGGVS